MRFTSRTIPTVMHANCGHGEHRKLEDCAKLNFISAGQGVKREKTTTAFGRQIRNLIIGDVLAVYRNKVGYVGIAQVISDPMDINNAVLGGKKVTPATFSEDADMFDNHDNEHKEWLVGIKWLTNVYLGQTEGSGVCYGVFPTQAVTCSLDNQQYLKQELQKAFNLNFDTILNPKIVVAEEDDEISFPEGQVKYSLHKDIERNRELIKLAKEKQLKQDEKLCCQACGFSFVEKYGELGKGFIEAHHLYPISKLTKETETTFNDLAFVCSNCHRMIHRHRPWLETIEQLKELVLTNA